jgi:hypothetical protein
MMEEFKPEQLIGKKMLFQCQSKSVSPVILNIGDIISHTKATTRGWKYIGRCDLVKYKCDLITGAPLEYFILEYKVIVALIKKGVYIGEHGLKYEILPDFLPPFRVGKKQMRAVLDANGHEVVTFPKGLEIYAKEYVEFLNKTR